MRSTISLFLIPILLLFFLASCATSKHRGREGDNTGQETTLTVEDEKRMTQEALPQMQKDYPPVQNPALQEYISELGDKIVKANKLGGNPYNYTFTAVKVDYVNAFALPAGTVFVTTPLIAMTENEAELAGVIGHEIGHIMARHTAERMDAIEKNKTKDILFTVGGGILGGAAGFGLGKLACKKGDNECLAKATVGGAALGAGGTYLVQKYKYMANSREDEMEADRIGFRLTVKAGYSKDHVGTFYKKLLEMEKKYKGEENGLMKSLGDAMSTHPPSEERVQQMNEMAQTQPAQKKPLLTSERYLMAKEIVSGK
ncbi:MAG: M48 family metalloprotease [Oligoflexia bacterium]|nr:M48 family metalloprotease [Oligoflexia bacterium]